MPRLVVVEYDAFERETTAHVEVGGRNVVAFRVISDTRLGAILPTDATSGYLVARTPGGASAATAAARLELDGPGPRITGIYHVNSCANPQPPGVTVLVVGTGLKTTYGAYADGVAVSPMKVLGDRQVAVRLPAGTGSTSITLTAQKGSTGAVRYAGGPVAPDRPCVPLF